jgi:ABC-type transport system substrate-binding protein
VAAQQKVLRYAMRVAETGFDPVRLDDLYSIAMISHVFDAPLTYDYLARPAKLKPNTAAAMPVVSPDGLTITLQIRPGIHFADDPAFGGHPRELTAHDYVYSVKRHFDPRWKSPNLYIFEGSLAGLDALRRQAIDSGRPFDYDRPVEGIRALDRYTLRLKLTAPNYNLLDYMAYCPAFCAVAREVVEAHGERTAEHPVGTGPYRLAFWKRSSKMVFERNPRYREVRFEGEAPPGDPGLQAVQQRLQGKRLPIIDRVEVSVIDENQPRWLAFLNGEHDLLEDMPPEFANIAIPNGRLAPHLAKRGITLERQPRGDVTFTYFAWNDPVVGGTAPENVALRRAMVMGYDTGEEISTLRKNQAIAAEAPVSPGMRGYDPAFHTEANQYAPARAKALLDVYGYRDRDADGYRERPDGSPLLIEYGTGNDQGAKQANELWKKHMDAIGVRLVFRRAKWPEQLKAARAGKLMMWGLAQSATIPDADVWLSQLYGPNAGAANLSRFALPAFDRLYERYRMLPDGPERNGLIREMNRLVLAQAAWKLNVHRIATDLSHPWLVGYRRHPVMRHFWSYLDVLPSSTVVSHP